MLVLLAAALLAPVTASRAEQRPLTMGFIGYGQDMKEAGSALIQHINDGLLNAQSRFKLHPQPALVSYDSAVDYLLTGQLDIALLTPTLYVSYTEHHHDLAAIATTRTGLSRKDTYDSVLLYDPRDIEPEKLRLETNPNAKPSIALIPPYSTSGYLLAAQQLEDRGVIARGGSYQSIEDRFHIRKSAAHDQSLHWFFSDAEVERVHVAAVYDEEIDIFIRTNLKRVEDWLTQRQFLSVNHAAGDAERMKSARDAVLSRCRFSSAEVLANDVIVVRQNFLLANQIEQVLRKLDEDMRNGSLPELLSALQMRNISGFNVASDHAVKARFEPVRTAYRTYRLEELRRSDGLNAEEVVREIIEDIGFKKWISEGAFKPRIAIVLSGGGASGAYQAGVLHEMQTAFANARSAAANDLKQDIRPHLFVGTSVGAINALSSALTVNPDGSWGRGGTDPGDDPVCQLWNGINSNRVLGTGSPNAPPHLWALNAIMRRPAVIALVLVLLALILQVFILLKFSHVLARNFIKRTVFIVLCLLVLSSAIWLTFKMTLAACAVFLLVGLFTIFALLDVRERHEPVRLPKLRAIVAPCVLLLGSAMLILSTAWNGVQLTTHAWIGGLYVVSGIWIWIVPHLHDFRSSLEPILGPPTTVRSRLARLAHLTLWGLGLLLLVIGPYLLGAFILEKQSLFSSAGLRSTMMNELAKLLDQPSLSSDSRGISHAVWRRLAQNETQVVIAAADLDRSSGVVQPRSVYFFNGDVPPDSLRAQSTTDWIRIDDNPAHALDMVMGSAAIFPAFPPHHIKGLKLLRPSGAKRDLVLVDGGALHNVPVAAAVQMQATHIIIVRVHPEKVTPQSDPVVEVPMVDILGDLFTLFFERAQVTDVDAVREQRAYLIGPDVRSIGLLEFDGRYDAWGRRTGSLEEFARQGQEDASSDGFRRVSIGRLFIQPTDER